MALFDGLVVAFGRSISGKEKRDVSKILLDHGAATTYLITAHVREEVLF